MNFNILLLYYQVLGYNCRYYIYMFFQYFFLVKKRPCHINPISLDVLHSLTCVISLFLSAERV